MEALATALKIDVDAAAALLAAADGDPETAVAIHVGYNGGELPAEFDLASLSAKEGAKREGEGDAESLRAAAADAAGGVVVVGAGVDLVIKSDAPTGGALWVGSQSAAVNSEWIAQTGVTFIVAAMLEPTLSTAAGVESVQVQVADDNVDHLGPHLRATCASIHAAITKGAAVLVHCGSGVSRSPTIVIAYFMLHRGLSLKDAYARVIAARTCISPGTTFFADLQQLEMEIVGSAGEADRQPSMDEDVAERQQQQPSMGLAEYFAYKVQSLAQIPVGPGPRYDQCVEAVRAYGWESDMAILSAAQAVAD